jgi:hypothetical protein
VRVDVALAVPELLRARVVRVAEHRRRPQVAARRTSSRAYQIAFALAFDLGAFAR